jgi:hypothetical protein
MINDELFLKIVRSAVKSPSGHNTQPWLFRKAENAIIIRPDFSKALPVADPRHRELFISLGCAAKSAMLAAQFYGFDTQMHIICLHNVHEVHIALTKTDALVQPELFAYINSRQTTRNLYAQQNIPQHHIDTLMQDKDDLKTFCYSQKAEIQKFAAYIKQGNEMQMGHSEFVVELVSWMRFSEKEALKKGDGLFAACSGVPSLGRGLGSFVMKNFVNTQSENKRLLKQLEHTAALMVFATTNDSVADWLNTGMAFQQFSLQATKLNINHSFLNSACQIDEVRNKMQSHFGFENKYPQLIVRMGYSPKMPYALHRNALSFMAE